MVLETCTGVDKALIGKRDIKPISTYKIINHYKCSAYNMQLFLNFLLFKLFLLKFFKTGINNQFTRLTGKFQSLKSFARFHNSSQNIQRVECTCFLFGKPEGSVHTPVFRLPSS